MLELPGIKENPCKNVTIPKEKGAKKNVRDPYTESEIQQMIAAALEETVEIKALVLTAFITGARQSEIAALEEKNINFDEKTIRFHQRISEVDDKKDIRLLPCLKNDDEEKVISAPDYLFDILKDLIKENKKIRWNIGTKNLKHYFYFRYATRRYSS